MRDEQDDVEVSSHVTGDEQGINAKESQRYARPLGRR